MDFFIPLFLYLSVASFPLISTSAPKEKHEEYFTVSLKHFCPAQESTDRHQKLVSINALCCFVMLHHVFWWVKMCRVTTPGYKECQTGFPSWDQNMAGFGMCSLFSAYVYMCFSRYMHTLTAVFFPEIWELHLCFMQAVSYTLIWYTWEYKTEPVVQSLN